MARHYALDMTQMMDIETGTNLPKGTVVRILNGAPTMAATVGMVGIVAGNMPNMLMIMTPEGRRSALKGWGTKANPGILRVEILVAA